MSKKCLLYVILTCIAIIYTMYVVLENQRKQLSFGYDQASVVKKWKHFRENSKYPIYKDLNCVATIPDHLVDLPGDMPIAIPKSLALPESVLACLYHRYVTTIQTPCVEPKLFGLADDKGGYLCVDKGFFPKDKCKAFFFGQAVNDKYRDQLKSQYGCQIKQLSDENTKADATLKSSNLYRSLRRWISENKDGSGDINLLVLTITENPNDIYIINELLQNTALMSRILQMSIKLYFNPATASAIGYEQRLLILRQLYQLHFRIFFFNQDLDCKPPLITQNKFLSCYSIYFIRARDVMPPIIQLPAENVMRKMTSIEHVRILDRYLSSLQIMCQQNIRVGNIKSGGWNVCHDMKYRPKYPCLAYSFGINIDWTFDEELTQTYGCDVFSFDPSIGRKDYRHSAKVWFYNLGINGKNIDKNWKLRNIDTIMRMLNHTKWNLDILKLDVEGAEWPSLIQMLESGILRKVGQLYLEFHGKADYRKLSLIKKLYDLGFRIYLTHKNLVSACILPLDGGYTSTCFEVYFLNTRFYR